MKRLEDLPTIANRQLGGLEATSNLLARVKLAAADKRETRKRPLWQPIVATCTALAFCIGAVGVAVNATKTHEPERQTRVAQNMMASYSAGEAAEATEEPRLTADVPEGSVTMSAGNRSSAKTLFEQGDGNGFPLVRVADATYRMLTSPTGISASLLGDSLGSVSEFNVEPALGSDGIVSNIVEMGESVYAVPDMKGAMIAANVGGTTRVFQRVSYAGTAIIGDESLADTLCDADDAVSITWAGVGEVSDADTVKALMQTLLSDSDYSATGMSGNGSIQIGLSNGLTMQLLVGDDTVSACGTWSCPDFLEKFHEAVGQ